MPTTEIYTLSLHDALPISSSRPAGIPERGARRRACGRPAALDDLLSPALRSSRWRQEDRKSTRLNSSHPSISYAVFCLKKKNNLINILNRFDHQFLNKIAV